MGTIMDQTNTISRSLSVLALTLFAAAITVMAFAPAAPLFAG